MLDVRSCIAAVLRGALAAPPERVCIVLVCYLDDSGSDKSSPVVTMAGYVSQVDRWVRFEAETADHFKRLGISVFHAKDFHDGDPPFRGWSIVQQVRLIDEWNLIGQRHVEAGLTISLPRDKWNEARRAAPKVDPQMSIYGQCFGGVLENIFRDRVLGPLARQHGISFVIEDGNKNNGNVAAIYGKLREIEPYKTVFRSLSFCRKEDCYAIQYADSLAFFSRRFAVDRVKRRVDMPVYLDVAKERVRTLGHLAVGFEQRPRFDPASYREDFFGDEDQ